MSKPKAIVKKLIQDYYHAKECPRVVQVTDDRKQLLVDLAEGLMYREK